MKVLLCAPTVSEDDMYVDLGDFDQFDHLQRMNGQLGQVCK